LKRTPSTRLLALSALSLAAGLAGCSSTMFSGERVDYRSNAVKINPLEVPPDLAQLSKDSRYQTQRGVVSASGLPQAGTTTSTGTTPVAAVAPSALGEYRMERDGTRRWLSVPKTPEQVWPILLAFWQDMGFVVTKKNAEAGVMETDWVQNNAKLPQDIIRKTVGTLLDSVYSTGELDQYRARIERTETGSEIFITHKGMEETYTSATKDATAWHPRPADPQLEAEMMGRLLVKLGATEAVAKNTVANPVTGTPAAERARVLTGRAGATLEVDDGVDKAWRRVGIALDRSGFTVEDRDRGAGLYYVRYVDPTTAGQDATPGFFAKLFGASTDTSSAALKYQVALKGEGSKTIVSVLNSQGAPVAGDNGNRIVSLLQTELK
jgi:outer membrane protein assembly factor BamC